MQNKILSLCLFIILIVGCTSDKQNGLSIESLNYCNFTGDKNEIKTVYEFASDKQAEMAMQQIMSIVGLSRRFELVASDLPYASAVVKGAKRYIYYNQNQMYQLSEKLGNKYASLSILAHEIGHHIEGHTLSKGGSTPELEIEADRFSGHIMARMGATLQETCAAINYICPKKGSDTHPPRQTRLAAITNGWMEAQEMVVNDSKGQDVGNWIEDNTETSDKMHFINIDSRGITLRSRALSPEEFLIANREGPAGDLINNETIVQILYDGAQVKLLSTIGSTYFVEIVDPKVTVKLRGYISKKVAGNPTIRPQPDKAFWEGRYTKVRAKG